MLDYGEKRYELFLGAYNKSGAEEGIQRAFLSKEGIGQTKHLFFAMPNPSFLHYVKEKRTLFAVSEFGEACEVVALKVEGRNALLLGRKKLDGKDLCHISYSAQHDALFLSCYAAAKGDGKFYSLNASSLDVLSEFTLAHKDKPAELKQSHAHCALPTPDGKFLVCVDLGLDRITIFALMHNGCISNIPSGEYQFAKGTGPRHVAFHPTKPILYSANELNSTLTSFHINANGGLEMMQEIPSTPSGQNAENFPSAIVVDNEGKFVLIANRGANTIAVFELNAAGMFKIGKEYSCEGDWPRHIALTHDNNYLLVANQKSGELVTMTFDAHGKLTPQKNPIKFPNISCMVES